jgi:putative ABC transport system substrate-binding protein
MRRREFITGLAGAAVWPAMARAQEPTMPTVGIVVTGAGAYRWSVPAFFSGLTEMGYFVGRNLAVEIRSAEGSLDRVPDLTAELVSRQVDVICAMTTPAALAAKAATQSIPIVFAVSGDPVAMGLVTSLNHPERNLTGVSNLVTTVVAKRLELLHELVPTATSFAFLLNPNNPIASATETKELQDAASTLGVRLLILNASDQSDLDRAFTTAAREQAGGIIIGSEPTFTNQTDRIVALAARQAIPAIFAYSEQSIAGGLASYGTRLSRVYQLLGNYVGRILKGEKPADLPVQQITKIELVINMKTAKALGIAFPNALLARADEVIE